MVESWQELGLQTSEGRDGAALHSGSRPGAKAPKHKEVSCDQVAAGKLATIATDGNQAATHPLSSTGTGISLDQNDPPGHPFTLARVRCRQHGVSIAMNPDYSPDHLGTGPASGIASHVNLSALHSGTEVQASIAVDGD
jgi:hypothetical protein